ncbi:MAG: hypothetical protein HKO82_11330, partial [Acidimicrobiia bacterium]|nr:hypothetical protein [Acidimicrobiia bacterium]
MNRLYVLAAVVLAACSGTGAEPSGVGTSDPIETTVPATVSSVESPGSTRAEIEATLAGIGPVTTLDQAKAVIEAVGGGMETDLVPYAYDAARVSDADTFRAAMATIGRVIGEAPPTDEFRSLSRFYGDWIMNNAPDPGPAYIPWKGALFANIDPEFEPLIASVEDPVTV